VLSLLFRTGQNGGQCQDRLHAQSENALSSGVDFMNLCLLYNCCKILKSFANHSNSFSTHIISALFATQLFQSNNNLVIFLKSITIHVNSTLRCEVRTDHKIDNSCSKKTSRSWLGLLTRRKTSPRLPRKKRGNWFGWKWLPKGVRQHWQWLSCRYGNYNVYESVLRNLLQSFKNT
jgi:hypothetical protein